MADTPITKLSALDITPDPNNPNNGFYVPELTTEQRDAIPSDTLRNGLIIYNSHLNMFQVRMNAEWYHLNVSVPAPNGIAGVNGSPLILPTGERADVEVAENEITGFIYFDTTNEVVRIRTATEWTGE